MRALGRRTVAVGILAGLVGLGCLVGLGVGARLGSVDTSSFTEALDHIHGVRGSLVEVQHPGLPTNSEVVVWLFVGRASLPEIVTITSDVAHAISDDEQVRSHQVSLAVVAGAPADYSSRTDVVHAAVPMMNLVAQELGLGASGDMFLALRSSDVSHILASGD